MSPLSEIHITVDMRRWRITDVVPFGLRDVCGLFATGLLGAGVASWALALAVQILEAAQ